jgi:hypothetical protein
MPAQLAVSLRSGLDWASVKCISFYCEEASADLAHVAVTTAATTAPAPASPAPQASPSPRRSPSPKPPVSIASLPNCIELIPGVFNLHWGLEGGDVLIGLEGRTGGDNRWMGFGFSPAEATDAEMVGSDVVIGTPPPPPRRSTAAA